MFGGIFNIVFSVLYAEVMRDMSFPSSAPFRLWMVAPLVPGAAGALSITC